MEVRKLDLETVSVSKRKHRHGQYYYIFRDGNGKIVTSVWNVKSRKRAIGTYGAKIRHGKIQSKKEVIILPQIKTVFDKTIKNVKKRVNRYLRTRDCWFAEIHAKAKGYTIIIQNKLTTKWSEGKDDLIKHLKALRDKDYPVYFVLAKIYMINT